MSVYLRIVLGWPVCVSPYVGDPFAEELVRYDVEGALRALLCRPRWPVLAVEERGQLGLLLQSGDFQHSASHLIFSSLRLSTIQY